jgi:hypothetical protein
MYFVLSKNASFSMADIEEAMKVARNLSMYRGKAEVWEKSAGEVRKIAIFRNGEQK